MIDEVVILAAGMGSRMAEITKDCPKCMAPFLQGSILSRLLGQLKPYQPSRIHIVGGYKLDVLEGYLRRVEFAGLPINLLANPEYATTNSLVSAGIALRHARGQLLMFNSDVVYEAEIVRRMIESDEPCAMSLDSSDYNEESEKLVLDGQGRVVQIAKTIARSDAAGCSADFYRVENKTSGSVVSGHLPLFMHRPKATRQLFEDYIDHCLLFQRFGAVDISGLDWYEIDTVAELKEAEQIFRDIL